MRIKTITASTMADALSIIREQLGPEALILATRKVKNPKGENTLEITAALRDEPPAAKTKPQPPVTNNEPRVTSHESRVTPLQQHALPPDLLDRLNQSLPALIQSGFAQADALEMLLGKLLPLKPPTELFPRGGIHVLVGPTGAGKTTLIAKLAKQFHSAGTRVGLLSLDDTHPAGFARLQHAADALADAAYLLQSPADLTAAAQQLGPRHVLFIDTPGLSPSAPSTIHTLAARLQQLALPTTTHLVLPANLYPATLAVLPTAFALLAPSTIIFTKLDDTEYLGPLTATLAGHALPGGLFTHSPHTGTPPQPLTARYLAEALSHPPKQPWEY